MKSKVTGVTSMSMFSEDEGDVSVETSSWRILENKSLYEEALTLDIPMLKKIPGTKDFVLGVPNADTWALYHKDSLDIPILAFTFETREIFPSNQVTYCHEKEVYRRLNTVRTAISEDLKCKMPGKLESFNKTDEKKALRNMFETLYLEDDDIDIPDPVYLKNKIDFQLDNKMVYKQRSINWNAFNKTPKKIKNFMCTCNEIEEIIKEEVYQKNIMLNRMRSVLSELKSKITLIDAIDITICASSDKSNLFKISMPTQIGDFIKEEGKWFGFKVNPQFYYLMKSIGVSEDIFVIQTCSDITNTQDFFRIYDTLLNLCTITKSGQFIKFCHCYRSTVDTEFVTEDERLTRLTNTLMPGFIITPNSLTYFLTKYCSYSKSKRSFMIAIINKMKKFFLPGDYPRKIRDFTEEYECMFAVGF